ncbi:MAG TPA: DivIVA domain-containing protein [Actinomycetota bacterium]|nr:DivIVA domain-containing protein [Actinomycetota bacterium]
MDLTARHIHEKQFHDAWRGYNQEEVDDFLDRVAEVMNRLERENAALQARLRELDHMVETSRSTEDMLKKTLVTAQKAAEEAIATAKSKAEGLVAEAEARAQRANDELKHRVATAEEEVRRKTAEVERQQLARRRETQMSIDRLEAFESEIKSRLKAFLEQQLTSLDKLVDKEPAEGASRPPQKTQPAAAAPAPAPRLHAAPSPALKENAPSEVRLETKQQAAVATEEPEYMDFTGDAEVEDFVQEANGDAARKRPLRGIFRREAARSEVAEDDWSEEDPGR